VEFEGEVGVVIGKKAKDVPVEKALEYILGYTCVDDVSERGAQKTDPWWIKAKGYDTFAPIGPSIQTDLDPGNISLKTLVNDKVRQSYNTSDLLFGIPFLVNYISGIMTLFPGDIISTGTSSGTGQLNPGDKVEITIEGLGTLRHYVQGTA
jgi:2-keto-4-pentenoate hydratase/2-oxohepta-3-ene-1,7-dioic acid hydratase in catechol pathway